MQEWWAARKSFFWEMAPDVPPLRFEAVTTLSQRLHNVVRALLDFWRGLAGPRRAKHPKIARGLGDVVQTLCKRCDSSKTQWRHIWGQALALQGQALALQGQALALQGQALALQGQALALQGQALALQGTTKNDCSSGGCCF